MNQSVPDFYQFGRALRSSFLFGSVQYFQAVQAFLKIPSTPGHSSQLQCRISGGCCGLVLPVLQYVHCD